MSTVITNSFRMRTGNLFTIYDRLNDLRKDIQIRQAEKEAKFISECAVRLIDISAIDGSAVKNPYSQAYQEWEAMREEMKKGGITNVMVDTSFRVSLMPHRGSVYGVVHTADSKWANIVLSNEWAEPFDYWDNTDRDDAVSAREWRFRKKTWDAILHKDSRPSQCGVTFEVLPNHYRIRPKVLLDHVPSLEERANQLALDRLIETKLNTSFDNTQTRVVWSEYFQTLDWIKTDEGRKAKQEMVDRVMLLLPTIDEGILVNGIADKPVA